MVLSGDNIEQTIHFSVFNQAQHTAKDWPRVSDIRLHCILNHMEFIFKFSFFFFWHSEIKTIIDAFGSHLHVDLQQRSVEFSQLFKATKEIRSALLDKMPRMQVSRVNNRNSETNEDNFNDLIENELEENDLNNTGAPTNDSVCLTRH